MIARHVFMEMIQRGAFVETDDPARFHVNYFILHKYFPDYVEECVLNNLNELEQWAYLNDYMAYTILSNGMLEWKRTNKI